MTEVPRQSPQTHMYERQGNMEEAIATYQKSLELKPEFSFALYGLCKGSPNITFAASMLTTTDLTDSSSMLT